MPMQGGRPSKLSKDLGNVTRQLKSGKTRSANPRDLDPDEITALERKRDALQAQIRETAKTRAINRINAHITSEADRVVTEVSTSIRAATAESASFFQAVNGAGSSTDLRAQAAVLKARATEKAKEERKAHKEAERKAKRCAASSGLQPQMKRARTEASSDAQKELMKKTMPDLRSLLSEKGLNDKGKTKKELVDRLLEPIASSEDARTTESTTASAADAEIVSTSCEDAESTGSPAETPRCSNDPPTIQIGNVVTLRDIHGHNVPEEFRDVALTVTHLDPEQNKIKFVAAGKREVWYLDGVDAVPAKPLAIEPALQEWLRRVTQSAGSETKCGYPKKDGGFCNWTVEQCPVHCKREGCAMVCEDNRSRQMQKGICDVIDRSGCVCTNVKGECQAHAPEELRCASMLEDNADERCWNRKQQGSDFCHYHQDFPNFGVNAKAYGEDCHLRTNKICSYADFLYRFYPTVKKQTLRITGDNFLMYLKQMSGHDDLREIRHKEQLEPKFVGEVKKIVDLLFPVIGDARSHAEHVNDSLSEIGSPFCVKMTEASFVISFDVKGQRYEVAEVSHP